MNITATYLSYDTIKELDGEDSQLPTAAQADLLSMLNESGVPSYELSLKVGCIASVMRNLSMDQGLVKNVRVQVIGLRSNIVCVQKLHSPSTEAQPLYLPRINFEFQPNGANWTVQRRQFPLRPAYATTFNSCQGLTLDGVVLDLTTPVFAHGQLYTSLSRVRDSSDIWILRNGDEVDSPTLNVVYPELLLQHMAA
jgi:hypothetical protein